MSFIVNLARTGLSLALIVATSAVSAAECVPSPWGADDQIGAANRVTPERTAAAAKLVKKGISHPLGIEIDPKYSSMNDLKILNRYFMILSIMVLEIEKIFILFCELKRSPLILKNSL